MNESRYQYKNFALHRMKNLEITQKKNHLNIHLILMSKNISNPMYSILLVKTHTIKLKFAPHSKDYILERGWFPNQKERSIKK